MPTERSVRLFGNIDISQLTPLPSSWTNLKAVGEWVVGKFFGLNWDNVQAILVETIGVGNVALAGQVLEWVQEAVDSPNPAEAMLNLLRQHAGGITAEELATRVMQAAATAAAIQAMKTASQVSTAVSQNGTPNPAFKTLASSMVTLGKDLKAEIVALRDAGATCFFGQACFAAGTPLRTPCGWRAIEALAAGDTVLSREEHDPNGLVVAKVVEAVFVRTAARLELGVGERTIGTSSEHPFYVVGRGWTRADRLAVGDRLCCEDGSSVAVASVRETGEWVRVYNLRVADYHTYFVGKEEWGFAVWAHNAYVGYAINSAAQAAIDEYRVTQGYPVFDQEEYATGTVAVIKLSSHNIFAAAGNLGDWGEATYPIVNRRRWFATLRREGLLQGNLATVQSLSDCPICRVKPLCDSGTRHRPLWVRAG